MNDDLPFVSFYPAAFFAHGGRAAFERGEGFLVDCRRCGREVSAPWRYQKKSVWCLYCGMQSGFVPSVEIPFGLEFSFGVTADECAIIRAACDDPATDLHAVLEARARRLDQFEEMEW